MPVPPEHNRPAQARPQPAAPVSRSLIRRLAEQQSLNFWLTNRIPRNLLTRWFGRFSRIRNRTLTRLAIGVWQRFADDLRLDEAENDDFESLHQCFTRRLRPGARRLDPRPEIAISPCDAVVGAHGPIRGNTLVQAKGLVYSLDDLVLDPRLAGTLRHGSFVTLRLKSSMYHRFHAPISGRIQQARYISGEVFNVNPPSVRRIQRLFCRNERAVVEIHPATQRPGRYQGLPDIVLVPVAAVLVASMRLHFVDETFHPRYRGPETLHCDALVERGQELGLFHHGSTIIVLFRPGFRLVESLREGSLIRMGEALARAG